MLKRLLSRMLNRPRVSWKRRSKPTSSPIRSTNPSHRSAKVSKSTERINPPMSEIVPSLFIGGLEASGGKADLENHNIKSFLTLTNRRMSNWSRDSFVRIIAEGRHLRISISDNSTQDLLLHMKSTCDIIEVSIALGGVLVHCKYVVSRSAAIMIAYLMRRDRRNMEEVLVDVKAKRNVRPNENFKAQLKLWGEMEYEIWLDEEQKTPKPQYEKMLKERGPGG